MVGYITTESQNDADSYYKSDIIVGTSIDSILLSGWGGGGGSCDEFSSLSKCVLFSEHFRLEYTRPIVLLLFSLMTENNVNCCILMFD